MKNNHKRQLINPDRMFRFISKAKSHGNEFYSDVHTPKQYKEVCKKTNVEGHQILFGSDDDDDDVEKQMDLDIDDNSDEEREKVEDQEISI